MSDPTERVLELTRVFEAPRDLVYACMTEPAHLTHFWGPTGTHAPIESQRAHAAPVSGCSREFVW